jgi:hypothetical protein
MFTPAEYFLLAAAMVPPMILAVSFLVLIHKAH